MIIYNGDHAEFELQNENLPEELRPDWPLPSFDARDWAAAFCKRFRVLEKTPYGTAWLEDEALMVAWFANALMRGYDEGLKRRDD